MMSPKAALRGEIKKLLKSVSPAEFLSQGESAAVFLRASPVWFRCKTIFLFLSTDFEIDTLPLLEAALREGKKVFAPKAAGDGLVFFSVSSVDGPWHSGPYGIREPSRGNTANPADFPALVIAPGLAFDRERNRLGRGGGYYDRFFARLDKTGAEYTALGFCMDFQLVKKVPAGELDKKMDGVLTGTEFYGRGRFPD